MTRDYGSPEAIAALMAEAKGGTAVFTGAGMSTDSGLPDFRSANGVWSRLNPMETATESVMRNDYDRFFEFYKPRLEMMESARPNEGHRILADWEARGFVSCVITQNVDGLHRAAGSRAVCELHGTIAKTRCMDCGRPDTNEHFIARAPCPRCGGRLRPGVVLFSENLPGDTLGSALNAGEHARVYIVLGSSLQVSPANRLPAAARNAGAQVVICNRDPTPLDGVACYSTNEGITSFLAKLDRLLPRVAG